MPRRPLVSAWWSYRNAGPTTLAFLAARCAVVPWRAIAAATGDLSGELMSVGCGHGLVERYVTRRNPRIAVVGYELDERRVAIAAATAEGERVRIVAADVRRLPDTALFDAILCCDVLHHLDAEAQRLLLKHLASRLRPGGRLIVKDIAATPRWKCRWNEIHDRIVSGDRVTSRDPHEVAEDVEGSGLTVRRNERVARWQPYPHFIVVAELVPAGRVPVQPSPVERLRADAGAWRRPAVNR